MAPDSKVETFAALQLEIDSWRWQGVPFYIRAGKSLARDLHGDRGPPAPAADRLSHLHSRAELLPIPHQPRGYRSRSV